MGGDLGIVADHDKLILHLLSGDALLLVDKQGDAIRINVAGMEERALSEPMTQTVVRGPMEAFTEKLRTNTSLIRRRIKDSHLRVEERQIGRVTKTSVAIVFISNIAEENVINEVRRRLDKIDIDGVLESGYIEEFIQKRTLTPFPTVYNSERPDTVSSDLLEGRQSRDHRRRHPVRARCPRLVYQLLSIRGRLLAAIRYQQSAANDALPLFHYCDDGAFFLHRAVYLPSRDAADQPAHQSGRPARGRTVSRFYRSAHYGSNLRSIAGGRRSYAAHGRPGGVHRRNACHRPSCRSSGHYFRGYGHHRLHHRNFKLYHSIDEHVDFGSHAAVCADGAGRFFRPLRHADRCSCSRMPPVQAGIVRRAVYGAACAPLPLSEKLETSP